jgi:beta-galactosidase/beta-glucuronidase
MRVSLRTLDADHPRPQLRRTRWRSLDGTWEFAIDHDAKWHAPDDVSWDRRIVVPFAPETLASGIAQRGTYRACWYQRSVDPPELAPGERLILHFGAVDHEARIWVDSTPCCIHEGGYTPFAIDVTRFVQGRPFVLAVRAYDDPSDLTKPRGKQDWQLDPHSIWYERTSGIWQSVWLEIVGETSIASLRWTPNLERWEIAFEAAIEGEVRADYRVELELRTGRGILARDTYELQADTIARRIAFSDPGIDDSRNELLWSPESPTLIAADLRLYDGGGRCLDVVSSYTGLRSIGVQGDRIMLNGRPYPLRMVLDQGYWSDTGLTPASHAALRRDVELAKAMGFNGVRKHQKIEDPRYLYWADRLGLLVWEEMPSAYRFTRASIDRVTREWLDVLSRDYSHPCIAGWVPFNESWGVPNLPDAPAERHWVQALYHLTKTLDPTRPVIGNDGWESVATDIIGVHDYDQVPAAIAQRYHSLESRPRLFRHARPGGRILVLGGDVHYEHPMVLSEFGGIACADVVEGTWGYGRCATAKELALAYGELLDVVRSLELLAGFCYTQFADTYQEANGLLYADRTPKFALEEIAAATRGPHLRR